jgi:hypothetical protein
MATNNSSSPMPTLSKVFVGAGLALIIVSIFFREFIFLLPKIGIALLWAGIIFQYYHLWKTGQKEKLREVGFRLLIIFAMVGLLFVLSVLL